LDFKYVVIALNKDYPAGELPKNKATTTIDDNIAKKIDSIFGLYDFIMVPYDCLIVFFDRRKTRTPNKVPVVVFKGQYSFVTEMVIRRDPGTTAHCILTSIQAIK